jgi:hypothetical protein
MFWRMLMLEVEYDGKTYKLDDAKHWLQVELLCKYGSITTHVYIGAEVYAAMSARERAAYITNEALGNYIGDQGKVLGVTVPLSGQYTGALRVERSLRVAEDYADSYDYSMESLAADDALCHEWEARGYFTALEFVQMEQEMLDEDADEEADAQA